MKFKSIIIMATLLGVSATIAIAQEPEATPDGTPPARTGSTSPMTGERLVDLVKSIDDKASNQGNTWQFTFQERPIILIYDEKADRMRMFTPIGSETALDAGLMRRMLQANFDSALDARYAVANNLIWGVFIHPLSPLDQDQFTSAIVQVLNVATSFGSSFSSGLFTFNGGDSIEENRKLLEALREKLNPTI